MRLEIRMPRLSEFSDEAVISKWRVDVGAVVQKGEVVAEVDLDMTRTEIKAQADGKVAEIWVHAGQKIPVETVIAMMVVDDAAIVEEPIVEEPQQETAVAEAPVENSEDDSEGFPELGDETNPYVEPGSETEEGNKGERYGNVMAAPEAIQLAVQHNINLDTLIGTGSCGLIERADVEAAMQANSQFITAEDVDDLMNFEGDLTSTLPSDASPPVPEAVNEPEPAVDVQPAEAQPGQWDEFEVEVPQESTDAQVETPAEEPLPPAEDEPESQEVPGSSPGVIYMGAGPESAAELEALAVDESDTIIPADEPNVEFTVNEEPMAETESAEPEPATEAQFIDQGVKDPLRKSVKVRRLVARKMQQSWQNAPHFFVTVAVDMTDVIRFRSDLGVTINDFILAATTRALQEHPWVNSHFVDDEAVEQAEINISLAVETEQGLYYPIVKNCAGKSVKELGLSSAEMVVKAHSGKLTEEDMADGSFTISNMGMLGVESFSAIITPPQIAVLAVGTVRGEVVIDEYEEMAMAPIVRLTLSGDHRALDGADAADFLGTMKSYLEAPITLVAPQEVD